MNDNPYYLVVKEWDYPDFKGSEPYEFTISSEHDALEIAEQLCKDEFHNFFHITHEDPLPPEHYVSDKGNTGYAITPRNGLDKWYFCARVIKVDPIDL